MYDGMTIFDGTPVTVGLKVRTHKSSPKDFHGVIVEPKDNLYPGYVNVHWEPRNARDEHPNMPFFSSGKEYTGINPRALVKDE